MANRRGPRKQLRKNATASDDQARPVANLPFTAAPCAACMYEQRNERQELSMHQDGQGASEHDGDDDPDLEEALELSWSEWQRNGDDDPDLKKVLQLSESESRELEEQRIERLEKCEQEDQDRAMRESIKMYERFQSSTDSEALMKSISQAQHSMLCEDDPQDTAVIMDAYEEAEASATEWLELGAQETKREQEYQDKVMHESIKMYECFHNSMGNEAFAKSISQAQHAMPYEDDEQDTAVIIETYKLAATNGDGSVITWGDIN